MTDRRRGDGALPTAQLLAGPARESEIDSGQGSPQGQLLDEEQGMPVGMVPSNL